MSTRNRANNEQSLDDNALVRPSPFRRAIAWITLIAYIGQPLVVTAEVIADQAAAPNNRPLVDVTANGLPLVQIAPPSAAGVSHNQYTQFNVGPEGIILNNSQGAVLTQQAGYVGANPNLVNGSARVILNEVTSTSRSQLNGYTEVAGQQTEVIIANPNGITCNGCGFINASRGVLTTGTPVMGVGGSLDYFRVTGGHIQIGSGGLNASNTSQLDIITRSVQVNGELWANNINVITGANQVNYNTLGVQIIPGTGAQPTVGIDVALLGGMYANKIALIGTEAGVGVNSLGDLYAQTGDFTLDNAGQITLGGNTTAGGNINITSDTDIANSGKIYSQQNATLTSTTGSIANSGKLLSGGNLTLNAASVNSTDALGAGIDNTGNATLAGNINIITTGQTTATGQNIAGGSINIRAADINLARSQTTAWSDIVLNATAGNIDNSNAQMQSIVGNIILNATGNLRNLSGSIYGIQLTGNANAVNNSGGTIGSYGDLNLSAGSINNTNGVIGNSLNGLGTITLAATTGNLNNTGGQIGSDRDLNITANTIVGNGQVIAGRDASIGLQGNYTYSAVNSIKANRNLSISTTGTFANQTILDTTGNLTISAANIDNQVGGTINANRSDLIASATITNQGLINGGSALTTHSQVLSNSGSIIGGDVSLTATQLIENVGVSAFIGAHSTTGLLELIAPSIQNRDDTTSTDTNTQTMIYGRGQVILAGAKDAFGQYSNATQVLNQSALIQSGGNMSVYADTLTNTRRVLQMSNTFTPTGAADVGSGYWTPGSTVPGGAYPNMAVGGAINSSYLYTTYTGTVTHNSVASISPVALIVSGGDLNPHVTTLQNYWSRITANGALPLTGITVDQDSWRGATSYLQRTSYSGDWWYQNYTGYVWTYSCINSFRQLTNCGNAWGPQVIDTPLAGYDSSITANLITATGATINNVAAASSATPLGVQGGPTNQPPSLSNLTLPQGGLYTVNTAPQAQYLVETNPAFANRAQWLSSDWYFTHAGMDSSLVQKRLGDGFYEQQLVRDELMSLTGRALLSTYEDEQSQFLALMTSGAKLFRELKLAPGVGLTADQVLKLTDNVIIMETREVQGQKVLVPVVYLAQVSAGDLLSSGPLIAANNIELNDTKGFTNSGTIRAGNTLYISGQSINNRGGNLQSGGLMRLDIEGDIDFTSARVKAGSLALNTGGNLLLNTGASKVSTKVQSGGGTLSRESTLLGRIASMEIDGDALIQTGGDFQLKGAQFKVGGNLATGIQGSWQIGTTEVRETTRTSGMGTQSYTDYLQHVGSVVQIGGQSNINVGKDFVAQAAQIDLQGGGSINAGGNVELKAVKNSFSSDSTGVSKDHYGRNQSYDETLVGTNLKSGQGLTISSENDITLSSSNVKVANGDATLAAAGNINITADTERHESSIEDIGSSHGLTTTTTRSSRDDTWRTDSIGSSLAGDNVKIVSGKDINIEGSSVEAQRNIDVGAMGNVNIVASTDTYGSEHYSRERTTGLQASNAFSITDQGPDTIHNARTDGTNQSENRSSLVSRNGNLNIMAGGDLVVLGSDLAANTEADKHKIVPMSGYEDGMAHIQITDPNDSRYSRNKFSKEEQDTGKINLTAGGTVAMLAGQDTLSQSSSTLIVTNPNAFTKIRRTITDTFASLDYSGSTIQGESVKINAGNDIMLQATDVKAGQGGIELEAGNDILLLAAANTRSSSHQEKLATDGYTFRADGSLNDTDTRRMNNKFESQTVTNQVTSLVSGGDIKTRSGRNTRIEASVLEAQGAIDFKAGREATYNEDGTIKTEAVKGDIIFAAVKDSTYYSIEDSQNSMPWQSSTGKGEMKETLKLANIKAGKGLSVDATGEIIVDIPEVPAEAPAPVEPEVVEVEEPLPTLGADGRPISKEELDAVVAERAAKAAAKAAEKAEKAIKAAEEKRIRDEQRFTDHINQLAGKSGQEWIGQLAKLSKEKPDQVKLQQVNAAMQHWDYAHEGLTGEASAVIAIVIAYFTAGAGSSAVGTATTTAGTTTTAVGGTTLATTTAAGVTTYTVTGAVINAAFTTLVTQGTLSLINNKGDVGKTLNDMGKSENVKALVTSMITAGVLTGLSEKFDILSKDSAGNSISAKSKFYEQLQKNVINNTASTVVNHAINGGDLQQMLEQSLKNALIDTGAAQTANLIGDLKGTTLNNFTHKLAHALAGCAAGAAKSNDCSSGALGAVVGEITAELYGDNGGKPLTDEQRNNTLFISKLMAGVAAALTGGDVNVAAAAGENAVANNYLGHDEALALKNKISKCKDQACVNLLMQAAMNLSESRNAMDLLNPALARDVAAANIILGGITDNIGTYGYATVVKADELLEINEKQQATADAVPVLSAPQEKPHPFYNTFQARQSGNLLSGTLITGTGAAIVGTGGLATAGVIDSFATTTVVVKVAGGVIGAGANVFGQVITDPSKKIEGWDVVVGGTTGFLTTGAHLLPSIIVNTDGAFISSTIKGENPFPSMVGAGFGTLIGYPFGSLTGNLTSQFMYNSNPFRSYWVDTASGMARAGTQSSIPVITGNMVSSSVQEISGNIIKDAIQNERSR